MWYAPCLGRGISWTLRARSVVPLALLSLYPTISIYLTAPTIRGSGWTLIWAHRPCPLRGAISFCSLYTILPLFFFLLSLQFRVFIYIQVHPIIASPCRAGGGSLACRTIVAEQHGMRPEDVVLVCGGTSLANHYVINAMLHDGGLTVVEFPAYDPLEAACRVSHADNAKDIGTSPAYRIARSAPDFQISEEEWVSVLHTLAPRLIIVSNPHNPSGICIRNIATLLAHVDHFNMGRPAGQQTYVLVDEVYKETALRFPIPCAAALSPFAISTFSLTKTLGLSGVRMGIVLSRSTTAVEHVLAYHTVAECANPGLLEDLWLQVWLCAHCMHVRIMCMYVCMYVYLTYMI